MAAIRLVEIHLPLIASVVALLVLPSTYFLLSYGYLACWHRRIGLWSTIVHENGRLTLGGSLFYFDHFVGCVPMILLFALCAAGGFALGQPGLYLAEASRAGLLASWLLLAATCLVVVSFLASLGSAGWQATWDFACQRIERDGVKSRGGTWNQLQLSNLPIALGTIGFGSSAALVSSGPTTGVTDSPLRLGSICVGLAVLQFAGLGALTWPGLRAFLNPRWLAHSLREIATYPFTGIPVAFASILLVEYALSGTDRLTLSFGPLQVALLGACLFLTLGERVLLRGADVISLAQKPAFTQTRLSIPYLIASHVFEHALDFVLIGVLAGGIYAALRALTPG